LGLLLLIPVQLGIVVVVIASAVYLNISKNCVFFSPTTAICHALPLLSLSAVTTDVFQARLSRRCICILVSTASAEWCLAYGVSPPLSQSVWFKRHSCCVEGEKNLSLQGIQAFVKKY